MASECPRDLWILALQALSKGSRKKNKIRSNLGHCPNREVGCLRIKLIFQSVYEIFRKIPI